MEAINVEDLSTEHIGDYYDYEYTVDQGKGEITLIRQGLYQIRSINRDTLTETVTIFHPYGPQTFSFGTEILLQTENKPTGND